MALSVDSLRLERVERFPDHDDSFVAGFRTKIVQQRDGVLIQPALHSAPAQALLDALYGLFADQRQSFSDDLMLHGCTRFASERALPAEVFGPVLRPPCMRQRPFRGLFRILFQTAGARHA
jgi:hypothetical protein